MDQLLTDLYRRYKTGTKHVVQWLGQNAPSHTSVPALAAALRRLRANGQQQPVLVSVYELKQIAFEILGDFLNHGSIPPGLDDTVIVIESVLLERRECALLLRGNRQINRQDREHDYFIDAFESIRQDLKQINRRQRQVAPTCASQPATGKDNTNLFAALTMEETTAAAASSTHIPGPAPSKSAKTTDIEVKLADTTLDKRNALLCFLHDSARVRKYVRETWLDFKAGRITSENAALIETLANNLLRGAVNILIFDYPEFADYDCIADFLKLQVTVEDGELVQLLSEPLGMRGECSGFSNTAADLLCTKAYVLLTLMRMHRHHAEKDKSWSSTKTLEMRSHVKVIDASAEKYCQLLHWLDLLARVWADAAEEFSQPWPKDFVTAYLMDAHCHSKHKADLILVTCLQMRLDNTDVLEASRKRILKGLLKSSIQATKSITAVSHYAQQCRRMGEVFITGVSKDVAAMERDIEEATGKPGCELKMSMQHNMDGRLVSDFPGLCVGYTNTLIARQHRWGVELLNTDAILLSVAHLYLALHRTGYLDSDWQDMDLVLQSQGQAPLGIRSTAQSVDPVMDMTKHFGMAIGVQAQQYQGGKLTAIGLNSVVLPKHIEKRVKSASAYVRMHDAVRKSSNGSDDFMMGRLPELIHDLAKEVATESELLDQNVATKIKAKETLTNVEMLSALKTSLKRDELAVRFDTPAFFVELCTLLDSIRSTFSSATSRGKTAKLLATTDEPYAFVHEIFKGQARREQHHSSMSKSKQSGPEFPDLFKQCADIVEAYIATSGSMLYDKAAESIVIMEQGGSKSKDQETERKREAGLKLTMTGRSVAIVTPSGSE